MTRTRRSTVTTRIVALFTVLGLLLAACGTDDVDDVAAEDPPDAEPDEPEPDPDEEPADEPIELERVGPVELGSIAIPPIFAMLLPYVALEVGYFDKYAVDVNIRDMETGVDAARAVQGGDLDLAFSPTGPVMNFAGTGVDVAAIMGLDNIDWLVGSVNPDITSC